METRVHKKYAVTHTQCPILVKFVENYTEQHTILLPGRIPANMQKRGHETTYYHLALVKGYSIIMCLTM